MKKMSKDLAAISLLAIVSLYTAASFAQASPNTIVKDQPMQYSQHITGSFDVKLSPQPAASGIEAASLGRMSIDKQFHGDLDAHSLGEMLAAGTAIKGSAGYVAIERVTGSLQGKKGSFVLMHTGIMNRGTPELNVQVVPDSGTDELTGITGKMGIQITNGQHFYNFDYSLP